LRALSVTEAMSRLNISRETFYKLVRQGRLPLRKLDGRSLIIEQDLIDFMSALPRLRGDGGAS
jgi:excisionase family DNA binding protein